MKKKVLKIISGMVAIGLIILVFTITNAFVGNPISRKIADGRIRTYVEANYPDLDLEVSKATYNFKFNEYGAQVKSRSSQDTYFYVTYLGKDHITDSYKGDVLSGWNTFLRLNEAYSQLVEPLIEKNLPYEFDMLIVDLDKQGAYDSGVLTLDMDFNLYDVPLDAYVTLYIYHEEMTWENVAKVTLEVDQLMEQSNLKIKEYSVIIVPPLVDGKKTYESLGVYDFPKELLKEENLSEVMKDYYEKRETYGNQLKEAEIERVNKSSI